MKFIETLRLLSIALVAMVVLSAAGCGDDGDGTAPVAEEPDAPTKAEYIEQVDTLCGAGNPSGLKYVEDITAAYEKIGTPLPAEEAVATAKEIAKLFTERNKVRAANTEKMVALETPEEGGATAYFEIRDRIVAANARTAKAVTAYSKDVTDQDLADAFAAATEAGNKLTAEETEITSEYGFKVCGQPTK